MADLDPEFKQHLEEALAEVAAGDIGEVTADREIADLGLDSISLAEMVLELEDKIDVVIEPEDLQSLETFGDLEAFIKKVAEEAKQAPA